MEEVMTGNDTRVVGYEERTESRPPGIPAALDMLDSVVAQAEKAVAGLTEHLSPVLESPRPTGDTPALSTPDSDSEVAQRIAAYARRVDQLADLVADVNRRVALYWPPSTRPPATWT